MAEELDIDSGALRRAAELLDLPVDKLLKTAKDAERRHKYFETSEFGGPAWGKGEIGAAAAGYLQNVRKVLKAINDVGTNMKDLRQSLLDSTAQYEKVEGNNTGT